MSTAGSAEASPWEPWNSGLYAQVVDAREGDLSLRDGEGWYMTLDVGRWSRRADAGDHSVVERCAGRVLDIGCGAGRIVEALTLRGHQALGIDVCPSAVVATVCRGGAARGGSVFDPLPEEGRWDTALLMDGNIGIGGEARLLLRRVRELVHDQGLLIVETSRADVDERRRVRIHVGQRAASPAFPWAVVGAHALMRHARLSGWAVAEEWATTSAERHFVALRALA
ncbi:class I SAM-dependent methyltransferase [Streptomyces mirabilis]|uniref:class I SAM-dependent methyltransferase n=1 Tax=Streptomyces mirabilis TaxID=68239 RepID=UPI00225123B4|nr:methyltransferase domain-containing protein [Streptomyces mirabilis]MCX4420286.1 methyltransferase domain-containing protein [Streptomyces mirabilis]